MTYKNVSTTVWLNKNPVKVHAICTGTVAVKKAFRTKKGKGLLAKANIILDNHYTEFMPIWVWIIEHPDGIVLIDTGEIEAANDVNRYLEGESAIVRYQFNHAAKYDIRQEEELNYQLATIGLKPDDIQLVVLTHLHLDHTDGLKFFPGREIIVGKTEFRYPNNNMPTTYPSWFRPNPVDYNLNGLEVFGRSFSIDAGGNLLYVPTPGHTKGHSSVIFRTDEMDIIFAGDTSYTQDQLIRGELAGVNQDFALSEQTYTKLLAYAQKRPSIYLPSHDGQAAERLASHSLLLHRE